MHGAHISPWKWKFGLKEGSLIKNQGFIDGKWVDSKEGGKILVTSKPQSQSLLVLIMLFIICVSKDPATAEELGHIPEMGLEETKEAIDAASKAFHTWKKTTAKVSLTFKSLHRAV